MYTEIIECFAHNFNCEKSVFDFDLNHPSLNCIESDIKIEKYEPKEKASYFADFKLGNSGCSEIYYEVNKQEHWEGVALYFNTDGTDELYTKLSGLIRNYEVREGVEIDDSKEGSLILVSNGIIKVILHKEGSNVSLRITKRN